MINRVMRFIYSIITKIMYLRRTICLINSISPHVVKMHVPNACFYVPSVRRNVCGQKMVAAAKERVRLRRVISHVSFFALRRSRTDGTRKMTKTAAMER